MHKWRSEEQGILIGSLTAREDDPLLTNRYGSGRNPVRIILAGDHIPENLKMYQAYGKTMVFNTVLQKDDDKTEYFKIPVDGYLDKALDILHKSGIQSVLVEGGAVTHQKFFDKDLWDECRIITNTGMIMADGIPAAKFEGVDISHKEMIMDDLIQVIYNPGNQFAGRFIG